MVDAVKMEGVEDKYRVSTPKLMFVYRVPAPREH
jgi:hypothetical protein